MKRSAMLQAFRVLGRKPMVFLLVLPIALSGLLAVLIMPDMTGFLQQSFLNNPDAAMAQAMALNLRSIAINLVTSMLGLVSIFLLIPPALELFRDGAACAKTKHGWYGRGIINHWWKPITTGAITGGVYFVLSLPVMIVMMVSFFMRSFSGTMESMMTDLPDFTSPADAANRAMAAVLPEMLRQMAVYMVILGLIALAVYAILGLFLPALTDRKFGSAFKLMFSKRGFRNLPRMAGGLVILYIIPMAALGGLGALYVLRVGMPADYLGWFSAMFGFFKSWEFVATMAVSAFCVVLSYAFKFCVYQQVKEEEAAALPQQG